MKKYFVFAVLAIAMAAFARTGIVHAQTATTTSANTATEQQQLDVAKATLINLEMQAGMTPQGDDQLGTGAVLGASTTTVPSTMTATTGLSTSQVSYFEGALSQLVSSLAQLNATLQANPNMSSAQLSAIATTLGGMQSTVSNLTTQIAQDEQGGAPVAVTNPSTTGNTGTTGATATTGNTGVAQANPGQTATGTATAPATTTVTNPVQTTAQAGSIWSFAKSNWPVIVIIVLVIAILAILFWPEGDGKKPGAPTSTVSTAKTTTVTGPSGTMKTTETKVTVAKPNVDSNTQKTA